MAVRSGAPKPDISTLEAFTKTVMAARSLAFSSSASGVYFFSELFPRLGITDAIRAKSQMVDSGPAGALVARGEAEIAFQQISELLPVAGIDYVGPLPKEAQARDRVRRRDRGGGASPGGRQSAPRVPGVSGRRQPRSGKAAWSPHEVARCRSSCSSARRLPARTPRRSWRPTKDSPPHGLAGPAKARPTSASGHHGASPNRWTTRSRLQQASRPTVPGTPAGIRFCSGCLTPHSHCSTRSARRRKPGGEWCGRLATTGARGARRPGCRTAFSGRSRTNPCGLPTASFSRPAVPNPRSSEPLARALRAQR